MVYDSWSRRAFLRTSAAATAGAAAVALAAGPVRAAPPPAREIEKTRSYNPAMEYRRLGKTGLWVSAVCMGGHWKRINKVIGVSQELSPYDSPGDQAAMEPFLKNRDEVVSRCMEVGINCIDFAGDSEPEVYCRVIGNRREKLYLAYSHPASELRVPENRTAAKLLELFEAGLKRCRLEYVDIWRLMALERGSRHTQADVDAMIGALVAAKKKGLCRFTGISTHDRGWATMLMDTYPDVIQVLVMPFTPSTKGLARESIFDTIRRHDVGVLGIKPFSSNAIFKGDGSPDGPHAAEDDERARLAIRYVLAQSAITAPIPGLTTPHQVDNVVRAIKEPREFDEVEQAKLNRMTDEMWARLPSDYRWLRAWEVV